jgi:hypothetical protein
MGYNKRGENKLFEKRKNVECRRKQFNDFGNNNKYEKNRTKSLRKKAKKYLQRDEEKRRDANFFSHLRKATSK